MNLFHSARLKLTAFYFAVLVLFCLVLTLGIRALVVHEFRANNDAQRLSAHHLFMNIYDIPDETPPDRAFARAQDEQSAITREHLNRDIILIDVGVLVAGAALSYWYAGRTLRPIEAAHEEQKRFTADASHELRTPLAAMQLENEVFLRQKHFSEPEARQQLASNLEEVARLERLAGRLLALNRYEHGRVAVEPFAVAPAVETAIDSVRRLPEAREVTFVTKLAPAMVRGEAVSLTEIVGILLDNALKYGPAKGTIELNGTLRGEKYRLEVRDHGPGIGEADLPHIFERLYRGDKARSSRISGHGIGLSLARQIAEATGAELTAANHSKQGAVFRLQLPLSVTGK